ncbi:MAG: helicase-exonuclease AddAB subunit AddA [Oscillospiraceae bacterium]|nr:helicase-exonuclease AddAB subunit AddA [Oscillospiraceae bacterium]
MAKIELTPAQRAVVENRGGSLLVSAAAGSGKTKVLVDRLFSYVMGEGCNLDDFLIITYTRAAAAELRSKIASELAKRLAEAADDLHLRRQTLRVYQADIKTVDAFCSSLLRENVHLLNDGDDKYALSPDFRVLDEKEASLLQKRVLQQVLESFYEGISDDAEGHMLADTLGAGRDDRVLEEQVLQLYRKVQSHPYPEKWLAQQRSVWENMGEDISASPYAAALLGEIARRSSYWAQRLQQAVIMMEENEALTVKYAPAYSVTAQGFEQLAKAAAIGWDEAVRAAAQVEFGRVTAVRASDNAGELKEIVSVIRNAAKADLAKLTGYLSVSAAEAMEDMRAIAAPMIALIDLVTAFSHAYRKEKRRRNAADFSDQEHDAIRILVSPDGSPTQLGELIALRYKEIMVDEYQDTNEVQNFIFRAVSRGGKNLFTVGDVKQSIYRFRLADPTIFIAKYRSYLPYLEAAEGDGRKILLSQNFRSRKEILEATNFVFENILSLRAGEMDYGEEERLNFGAAYFEDKSGCETEYHMVTFTGENEVEEEEGSTGLATLEARFVARKIRQLLDEGFPVRGESGEERRIREEDIVILMRSPNTRKEEVAKALSMQGIAFSDGGSGEFFETAEIAVMFSFLKIIDNPRQDVPLISVLRSPLFGFTADSLARIRAASPKTDFYTALLLDEDQESKAFVRELTALRELTPEISVHRLLWHIYNRFHVLGIFGAMGGGEIRKDNLTALFEHVKKLENAGYSGLFALVTQLQRMIENGEVPDTNIRTASGGVRLMSIHKSKGLEFPVVILADLSKGFNDQDLRTPVLVHPALGVGAERVDLTRKIRYPTLARLAIERSLRSESRAEEMRILYVAMTRAKEKLIMVDSRRNGANVIKKLIPSAVCPVVPEAVCDGKCMGDWVLLPLLCRWEAKPLRDLAGMETLMHCTPGDTPWKVFIHDAAEYVKVTPRTKAVGQEEEAVTADLSVIGHMYPYARETRLPAKVTATQLKGREVDEEIAENTQKAPRPVYFGQPAFMTGSRALTAAEKGTALHLVMQYVDFDSVRDEAAVKAEVERLYERRLLRKEEAQAVDTAAIAAFLASPLAERIRRAETVLREYRFTLLIDAREYDAAAVSDDKMMLQGVVDCCIEEEGGLTVIDFKTDRVDETTQLSRAEHYRPQLEAYSTALERILEKKVKEKILYFFATGNAVKL